MSKKLLILLIKYIPIIQMLGVLLNSTVDHHIRFINIMLCNLYNIYVNYINPQIQRQIKVCL